MRIEDQLYDAETNYFVGRVEELLMMHHHASSGWKWQWLHIHGQGGIGKSSLLRRFQMELRGVPYFKLESCRRIEDVFEQLVKQLRVTESIDIKDSVPEIIESQLHRLSNESDIILLIDGFEECRPLEEWLSHWLRRLPSNMRIITAGRYPLTGGWLRSGWSSLIYSIPLPALNHVEVERYAHNRGIVDLELRARLFRFSGGIPLAMTIATEALLRGSRANVFAEEEKTWIISLLMEELTKELPTSVQQSLEAASVFWRFNEERLAAISEEIIETKTFRELIRMPFVQSTGGFWMLHDTVRAWVQEDLIRRKPQAYETMRKKALAHIQMEKLSNSYNYSTLRLDKLYLHEHPLVRSTCFSGLAEGLELRECRECDLPALESLYIRYHKFVHPSSQEERCMQSMIRPIWQADPSSFITIWRQNELVAFFGMIPLHERMMSVLGNEPLFHPFIRGWKPIPKAYISSSLSGLEPELEADLRSFILNAVLDHYSLAEWILTFTSLKEWFPLFELCGFQRESWADATTEYGTEFRAYSLDLSHEDFITKLDRLLTSSSFGESTARTDPFTNLNELKRLLKNFHNLPYDTASVQLFAKLFPQKISVDDAGNTSGADVQKIVLDAIYLLMAGNDLEVIWGKLLHSLYILRIHPNERVAERLNLSPSTYYRYLNKALQQLSLILSSPNAGVPPQGEGSLTSHD